MNVFLELNVGEYTYIHWVPRVGIDVSAKI